MPTVTNRLLDLDARDAALAPRDDVLIGEAPDGEGRFVGRSGVFAHWEREVAHDADGWYERVHYRTGLPVWGRLMDVVLRGGARRRLDPSARPWWAPSHRLEAPEAATLARCATLSMLTGFLGSLVVQTLTFIARDFGDGVCEQAGVLVVVRLGALLTALATAFADRAGRRRVLGFALGGSALAAGLTAAAPNLGAVAAAQTVCRGLAASAAIVLAVVVVEELPAHSRAYGIAVVAAGGGLGAGMVLWALPALDLADWAWRPIYLLGLVAGAAAVATVARLPETRRFVQDTRAGRAPMRVDRLRFVVLAGGLLCLSVFTAPTQQLQNDYLRTARGFSATEVTVFLLVTNVGGVLGLVVSSRFSDRRSRRGTYAVGLLGLAVGNSLMFQVGGPLMWVASATGSIIGAAVIPSLGTLESELFPTLRRGTASGLINTIGVAGSVIGLSIVGTSVGSCGDSTSVPDYGPTILLLALGPLVAALSLLALPETAGRDLDDINPGAGSNQPDDGTGSAASTPEPPGQT